MVLPEHAVCGTACDAAPGELSPSYALSATPIPLPRRYSVLAKRMLPGMVLSVQGYGEIFIAP
eukprot:499116-Rhodomonas_salina.1